MSEGAVPPVPPVPPTPPAAAEFKLPESIASKPYAHKYTSEDAVWKQIENLESLAGKKGYVPPSRENAEEYSKFQKQLLKEVFQVPDNADAYEFETIEGFERSETLTKRAKELFHKYDIPVDKAKALLKEYEMDLFEQQKTEATKSDESKKQEEALKAQMAKEDAEFDALLKDMYGADFNKKTDIVKQELATSLPDQLKPMLKDLDTRSMAILTSAIDSITTKYTGEGKFGKTIATASPTDAVDTLRKELSSIVANEAYFDFRHPDNAKLKKRVSEIEQALYEAKKKK